VLHLDHINGINNDNRRENLRFLCPNCHSQTPTYGNRARDGVLYIPARERGGIGRRGSLRSYWLTPWGFESPRSH
jgi:5-methylcytosine-specific restriction endonuclease McrA